MYGPFKNGDCDTNLVTFLRTCTTARINTYMIYANSTSTLQPEQTDVLVFELFVVLSHANVKLAWYTTWSQKRHSRLLMLAVGA